MFPKKLLVALAMAGVALFALLTPQATQAEEVVPPHAQTAQLNAPPADNPILDAACQGMVALKFYADMAACYREIGGVAYMPPPNSYSTVVAGKDFYAFRVDPVGTDGYMSLVQPTNLNTCTPVDIVLWKLDKGSDATNMSFQWTHCWELHVSGSGTFKFASKVPSGSTSTEKPLWVVTGNGGAISLDNGTSWTPFALGMKTLAIPAEATVKTVDANSYVTISLYREEFQSGGTYELKDVDGEPGWQHLTRGTNTPDGTYCAWPWQVKGITATGGMKFDFPVCILLSGQAPDSDGDLEIIIRGSDEGWKDSDLFGYGLGLWITGAGGWYSVYNQAGVEVCKEQLDSGAPGIRLTQGKEFKLKIHLTKGGHFEAPLGEVRLDNVHNTVVVPKCEP